MPLVTVVPARLTAFGHLNVEPALAPTVPPSITADVINPP